MRSLERLPLQYRVLCTQFVLRVIDLEALSVQADIPRYLGQFGGVLLMLGFVHMLFVYAMAGTAPWFVEQYLLRTMLMVAGFVTVLCWDQIFPDRRDVMVLGVMPIRPGTILLAKVSSVGGLLGMAVLALNAGPGLLMAVMLGERHRTVWGFVQSATAYWFAMVAVSMFLYCSALAVQGLMSIVLPRRVLLSLSSILQIALFTFLLIVYFLEPAVHQPRELLDPARQGTLTWSPLYWFVAMFNQMNSSLPRELNWLAWRGWLALGCAAGAAVASMVLAYLSTMKRTVEQPDLLPVRRRRRGLPYGGAGAAMLTFSVRSLLRSRQHRTIYAFYLSLVLALALSCLRDAVSTGKTHPVTAWFLGSTLLMLSLLVVGLRGVASIPLSLSANWVLKLAQMDGAKPYLFASRIFMMIMAVSPVWLFAVGAAVAGLYRPLEPVLAHASLLAATGWMMLELTLLGAKKAPFACSFLPGKSNVQARFWTFVIAMLPLTSLCAIYERRLSKTPIAIWGYAISIAIAAFGIWSWNRKGEATAFLQFDESEPDLITTLGIDAQPAGLERSLAVPEQTC